MKTIEKCGVISWLINYKKIKKEYIESQYKNKNDVIYLRNKFNDVKTLLDSEIENLNIIIDKKEDKINYLEQMLSLKSNKNLKLENLIQDRNKEIQDLHYELSKLNLKLDNIKSSFLNLRGKSGALTKELNKLKEEHEKSKKKIEFLKTKIPKKTIEDYKAYEYSLHEVLKRNK